MRHPQRVINRFTFALVAVFIGIMGATGVYWAFWQRPEARCESMGNWWDPQTRQCGVVVWIPDVTGRYVINGQDYRPASAPAQAQAAPAAAEAS